jgi:gas vesicle protein
MRPNFHRNDDFEILGMTNNLGVFLAGLFVGALAGATVMLFMAPQSGRELRDKSMELRDRVMETAEEARIRAGDVAEQARDKAQQVTEGARARLERR